MERGAKVANSVWAVVSWRGSARSARERLEQLRREGKVLDETHPVFRRWAER